MKNKILFASFFYLSLMAGSFPVLSQPVGITASKEKAVYEFIRRILPKEAEHFNIAFMGKKGNNDVFELESKKGKIFLRGTNGISLASALNYYLKNYAHCDISWNGSNLKIPYPLPLVPEKVHKETPYRYRYYLNYCTFNYTMSWWNWERWQWEIDWMALNGINMPLALTGQNSIWDTVYKNMGFTDKDLSTFFSGPAYFNWFWMGNLDGWGGPLPQNWMKSHESLQKKILARERELGMTPVLPAFTGHVPPAFKDRFPKAKLKKTHWSGFPDVYILDPGDSMFTEIGKKFLKEEIKTYGTDHLYSSDMFNENTPPDNDSLYLNDVSKKVYQAMASADPAAKWIMQGWLFHFSSRFWQPAQIKALLNAVPDDKMILLDLWSENNPVWNRTEAYYGKPWIWCMLHNFGGNISLYGRMDEVATAPASVLRNTGAGKMEGIGLTPEAIEQNPVIYELMLDNVWRNTPIVVDTWLKEYARRRYGKKNIHVEKAWDILRKTVYTGGIMSGGPESIITGRPTFNKNSGGTRTDKNYNPGDLLPAWEHLIQASGELKNSEGFQYDLVDVTRQVLANYADTLQQSFASAYRQKNAEGFKRISQQFLSVIDDLDDLLATRKDFLLGVWLNSAKRWGMNEEERILYEKNARDLITLWGDKNSNLHEYACKQWSGMLKGFYKPRWEQFFHYINGVLSEHKEPDLPEFEKHIKDWEWQWVNSRESYEAMVHGDPMEKARMLYQKYINILKNSYLTP